MKVPFPWRAEIEEVKNRVLDGNASAKAPKRPFKRDCCSAFDVMGK